MTRFKQGGILLLLALLSLPAQLHAAQSPFDIDLKELDRENPAVPPKAEKKKAPTKAKKEAPAVAPAKHEKVQHKPAAAAGEAESEPGYIRYTVKPGDHIFKILVTRLGMSNEAAERLIPEIIRVNHITNIKKLTVGRTLLVPDKARQEHLAKSAQPGRTRHKREHEEEVPSAPSAPAPITAAPVTKTLPSAPTQPVTKTVPSAPAPVLTTPAAKAPVSFPPVVAPRPMVPKAAAPGTATPTTAPALPTAKSLAGTPVAAAPAAGTTVPAVPPAPLANTWICSVTEKDPAKMVDAVMNALSLPWSKNRIIQSDDGAPNAFSIRVDRYFEYNGIRTIVSIGESDPYSYTLLRLLEGAGYRVLMINSGDDFKAVGEKMLRLVGAVPDFGKYLIAVGKENSGFLVQQEDAAGRRVLITNEIVNPRTKWTMPAGCGTR
jgi:hypothetical protein